MTYELTIHVNGSSSSIGYPVGGLTDDSHDLRAESIEFRQEAGIGIGEGPNTYSDVYMDVDYMGYFNPVYSISGTFDELEAEQEVTSQSSTSIYVDEPDKFSVGDSVYLSDSSEGTNDSISSVESDHVVVGSSPSFTPTKIRSREVIGRRYLCYLVEDKTEKVLTSSIFAPDGVCVQITNLEMSSESTSLSEGSNSSNKIGTIVVYSLEMVVTPETVT